MKGRLLVITMVVATILAAEFGLRTDTASAGSLVSSSGDTAKTT